MGTSVGVIKLKKKKIGYVELIGKMSMDEHVVWV